MNTLYHIKTWSLSSSSLLKSFIGILLYGSLYMTVEDEPKLVRFHY